MEAIPATGPTTDVALYRPQANFIWMFHDQYAFEYRMTDWAKMEPVGGLYLFAQEVPGGTPERPRWQVLYVGQSDDLGKCLTQHEKWDMAESIGATHVILQLEDDVHARNDYEEYLIDEFTPPLNAPA